MSTFDSQELLRRIEAGDSRAATVAFDRYVKRLLALARQRVGTKLGRRIDPEDVVQSAYRSFFAHAENHEYALSEAGDLWRLLARITFNKLYSQVEKHTAARRNIHREQDLDHASPIEPATAEPSAAEAIALTEQLQLVVKSLTTDEATVLSAHLRGDPVETVAGAVNKSPRTVRRLLEQTRRKIEQRFVEDADASIRVGLRDVGRESDPRAPLSYADFRLGRLLGVGGMGKVYRAIHLGTGKIVAIKALVKSRQADKNCVEKFLQEAQMLASLSHSSIVGFQGVGRFPGGGHFIVMDFIDGQNLQSQIAKAPLTVEEAVRIVAVVSQTVAYMHEKGIVHGDLKPANILIDRSDRVFVADFGLAQFNGTTPATRPWIVGGTAGYVAPEVRLHGLLPGPRSDVFGLGALLFALVTGAAPSVPTDLSCDEVLPPAVRAICDKCLAEDPTARFPSVAALKEQIDLLKLEPASKPHRG